MTDNNPKLLQLCLTTIRTTIYKLKATLERMFGKLRCFFVWCTSSSLSGFHFLSSNLRYFSLFEIFIANNVTSPCIMSSRLTLLYLVFQAEDHAKLNMSETISASRGVKKSLCVFNAKFNISFTGVFVAFDFCIGFHFISPKMFYKM